MWSLVLVSKLVTTTYCSSHYNLHLMAGRLAPASEVAGSEDIPYHFKKGIKRSSANYSDSSTKILVTNLLTSTNDHLIRPLGSLKHY
jgi:hypothetical protein